MQSTYQFEYLHLPSTSPVLIHIVSLHDTRTIREERKSTEGNYIFLEELLEYLTCLACIIPRLVRSLMEQGTVQQIRPTHAWLPEILRYMAFNDEQRDYDYLSCRTETVQTMHHDGFKAPPVC